MLIVYMPRKQGNNRTRKSNLRTTKLSTQDIKYLEKLQKKRNDAYKSVLRSTRKQQVPSMGHVGKFVNKSRKAKTLTNKLKYGLLALTILGTLAENPTVSAAEKRLTIQNSGLHGDSDALMKWHMVPNADADVITRQSLRPMKLNERKTKKKDTKIKTFKKRISPGRKFTRSKSRAALLNELSERK